MDRVPLWAEFTMFMAIILILLTFVLSFLLYRREQTRTVDALVSAEQSLLNLKTANLQEYINSLSEFSILPVYNSDCYAALTSSGELSDRAVESLRRTVRTYFHTRSDLLSYHIYLLNQDMVIGRDYGKEGVSVKTAGNMKQSDYYKVCAENEKNYAVFPSEHHDVLFHFVHSIIRINDKSITALVDFEVDRSAIEYLSAQSVSPGEAFSLYNADGALLYTDAQGTLKEELEAYPPDENLESFFSDPGDLSGTPDTTLNGSAQTENMRISTDGVSYTEIDGMDYLLVRNANNEESLYLSTLIPLSYITKQLRQTRQFVILTGLVFLLASVIGAYVLIRYLSSPLTALVKLQESFGEGTLSSVEGSSDISETEIPLSSGEVMDTRLGRSKESAELSRSFNQMTGRIEKLLRENYAAELNEKNARLTALEAQINPHFLYNTLQAVGSEALLNDQTEIYHMLTSLASNLRYSIKAPNVVSLRDELKYVDNYVYLQKIRMGEKLEIGRYVDESLSDVQLPKLCIQTLVENSILHGIGGERDRVSISLTIRSDGAMVKIKVNDNGIGIEEEELLRVRSSLRSQTLSDANQSIGLANLYNRLLLLYDDKADMTIDSRTGTDSYTEVSLMLPVTV